MPLPFSTTIEKLAVGEATFTEHTRPWALPKTGSLTLAWPEGPLGPRWAEKAKFVPEGLSKFPPPTAKELPGVRRGHLRR
jgi:hypothetical protein